MKITPRPDQYKFIADIHQAWNQGAQNVVGVGPTGFGKTVCLSSIIEAHPGASCIIAHRAELVGQVSLMLARYGIRHNLIAANGTKRAIAALHVAEFGACYYTPSAKCAVASIDTLVRADGLDAWAAQVTLWIVDEGHHLVMDNKWHRGVSRFTHPAARGLLPTATPERADGKGLGRGPGGAGIADALVLGPTMRWLIDHGHLTPYRIVCVESDLRMAEERVGASGDWSTEQLKRASERSRIVGDVVGSYLRFARGKRHITFTTDTTTAARMTAAYRAAGVRAECLTGKTDGGLRRQILRQFTRGEVEVIVAVDIISEGFDLPAIESCSFARPSASLPVVWQQFGRTLRTMEGKREALIIDHVGNVLNPAIGLPDRARVWSLDSRDRRSKASDSIPMRVCVQCYSPYERIHRECPHCGYYQEPESRAAPAMVDGDMAEMSPELAARLRGDIEASDRTIDEERARLVATGLHHVGVLAGVKHHAERQETQGALRQAMGVWGGFRRAEGMTDSQMQRAFFLRFGVSVPEAMGLRRADAQTLLDRIVNSR
jgi:DNA repair protein RadD